MRLLRLAFVLLTASSAALLAVSQTPPVAPQPQVAQPPAAQPPAPAVEPEAPPAPPDDSNEEPSDAPAPEEGDSSGNTPGGAR